MTLSDKRIIIEGLDYPDFIVTKDVRAFIRKIIDNNRYRKNKNQKADFDIFETMIKHFAGDDLV